MSLVSQEQIEQYHREGYFILESAIPEYIVEALQQECMRIIDIYDKEMEAKGLRKLRINHYKKRYFVANRSPSSPIMTEFLFSELMADICRATLGDDVYLYNEQYVVKPPTPTPNSPGIKIRVMSGIIIAPSCPAGARWMI